MMGDEGAVGRDGDPGEPGAAGEKGFKGEAGRDGHQGKQGPPGKKGEKGKPGKGRVKRKEIRELELMVIELGYQLKGISPDQKTLTLTKIQHLELTSTQSTSTSNRIIRYLKLHVKVVHLA